MIYLTILPEYREPLHKNKCWRITLRNKNMKHIMTISLLLMVLLGLGFICSILGCKEKQDKVIKEEPNETSVKNLYIPFADEEPEELTGIIHEPDDNVLGEPFDVLGEEVKVDPNVFLEEVPVEEPDEPVEEESYIEMEYSDELPEEAQNTAHDDPNDFLNTTRIRHMKSRIL